MFDLPKCRACGDAIPEGSLCGRCRGAQGRALSKRRRGVDRTQPLIEVSLRTSRNQRLSKAAVRFLKEYAKAHYEPRSEEHLAELEAGIREIRAGRRSPVWEARRAEFLERSEREIAEARQLLAAHRFQPVSVKNLVDSA